MNKFEAIQERLIQVFSDKFETITREHSSLELSINTQAR
jgi:hypothetical protein